MRIDDLARDIRQGLRSMRRTPIFTAVALLTLTLGIGANTAIFTIVNSVLLRPLAYAHPDQLMAFDTGSGAFGLAPAEYFEFRTINRSFAAVGAYTTKEVNLSAGDRAVRVRAVFTDGQLFDALELRPAVGRLFTTAESEVTAPWFPGDEPPPADVVVISHDLWQTAFGGAPVVGQRVDVDGRRREVVGIMPPGADVKDNATAIWLPLGLNPTTRGFRGYHILSVIGRLKDHVTPAAAQTELTALMANWAERVGLPPTAHVFTLAATPYPHPLRMTPLHEAVLGHVTRLIWILQAAVGVVLLIVCANLANLLLARAETRRREYAVRTALGASLGHLLRLSLVEGLLLSMGGAALGLGAASTTVHALLQAYPGALPRATEVTVDASVVVFALGISLVGAALVGLAPLGQTRLRRLAAAMKQADDRNSGVTSRHWPRRLLVVTQVALAVALVAEATLLVRTVHNLATVDAGFDRSRLVTFAISAPDAANLKVGRAQTYQHLLETLRAIPGVQAATAMSELPPEQHFYSEDTQIDNYNAQPGGAPKAVDYYQSVMSDYFDTMGVPIVMGRGFLPSDAAASGMVAVVNERLVKTFWNGRNPIGQRIKPNWGDWVPWFTVVGVAKDVRQNGVDRQPGTELYFFVDQMARAPSPLGRTPEMMNIVLRTKLPPSALLSSIQRTVHDVDPTVPVAHLRDMDAVFADSIRRPRLLAQLLGAFAVLALLLAAVGTYGLLAYMVAQRRQEIGVRMALGANRSRVVALVMREGVLSTVAGVLIGIGLAVGSARVIASMLFGLQPTDPVSLAAVIGTMAAVAVIASALPAWRAARVDPNVVLRTD